MRTPTRPSPLPGTATTPEDVRPAPGPASTDGVHGPSWASASSSPGHDGIVTPTAASSSSPVARNWNATPTGIDNATPGASSTTSSAVPGRDGAARAAPHLTATGHDVPDLGDRAVPTAMDVWPAASVKWAIDASGSPARMRTTEPSGSGDRDCVGPQRFGWEWNGHDPPPPGRGAGRGARVGAGRGPPSGGRRPPGRAGGGGPWPATPGRPRSTGWCRRRRRRSGRRPGRADRHLLVPAVHAADGSGWTGNVRFWWTPASSHQTRSESGSSLSNGRTPAARAASARPSPSAAPRRPSGAVDPRRRPPLAAGAPRAASGPGGASRRRRPGRMPSVTQALSTNEPDLGRDPHQVAGLDARAARRPRVDPERVACGRSRRATSRCPSACGSASAAGTSAAGRTRSRRSRSRTSGRGLDVAGTACSGHPQSSSVFGEELELARRRGEADVRRAVDLDADRAVASSCDDLGRRIDRVPRRTPSLRRRRLCS